MSFIPSGISFSVLITYYVDYGMRHVPQILVLCLEEAGQSEGELKERTEEMDD